MTGDAQPIDYWDMGAADGSGLPAPTNSVLHPDLHGSIVSSVTNSSSDPLVVSAYNTGVAFDAWRTNVAFIGAILVSADLPPGALGDYHLTPGSPAVDLGASSQSTINAPAFDIDKQSRPVNGVDSGADELPGPAAPVVPVPALLDGFDGANATTLGGSWSQTVSGANAAIRVNTHQAYALQAGSAWWTAPLGTSQLAALTFANAGSVKGSALLLKANGGTATNPFNAIRVRAIGSNAVVATTVNRGVTYVNRATFPAVFASGDTLVATALGDGTVNVYKVSGATTTLVGSVVIAGFSGSSGRIGMQLPAGARADNFAGQNLP